MAERQSGSGAGVAVATPTVPSPSLIRRLDQTHVPMLLARLVVGGVFLYLAFQKLGDPILFLKNIREYHLLPESPPIFINLTAVALPWIEIVCGVLLIIGLWIRPAALIVLGMLLAFTPAILFRAIDVYTTQQIAFCAIAFDCGCGTGAINICKKIAENGSLILLSLVGVLSHSRRFAIDRAP